MIDKLKRAAEFLGWEYQKIGFFDDHDADSEYPETKWQVKNTEWLDKVGCTEVGEYLLSVEKDRVIDFARFNPHEETGRHWLVEMISKLSPEQYESWDYLMFEIALKYSKSNYPSYRQWLLAAPSELCFENIMEVIEK